MLNNNKKVAVLIAGEIREFNVAHHFWPFLNIPDVDIYMSTWSTSKYENPIDRETVVEIVDRYSLEKTLNFKRIIIEDLPNKFCWGIHLYLYKIRGLIKSMLAENITYDVVIIIRPDLIFKIFAEHDLVNHILENVKTDNIIHTITNNWKISDTKLATDVLMIGTINTFKKFLDFIPDHDLRIISNLDHMDIHEFIGTSYYNNNIEVENLPIYRWTIARPNSRGKINPTFDILEQDAKIFWEYKYKRFFGSTENLYDSLNKKIKNNINPEVAKNKSLNLFNDFDYNPWGESGQVLTWHSTDHPENFEKSRLLKKHTYKKTDFTYNFNSLGFRIPSCNYPINFNDAVGYPTFMVAGCSVTEGVGLPENQLWHSFLIEKFIANDDTNKPIAKFNLGKAARGIDAITRYVYVSIEKYGATPDFIYLLLPSITRREIILDDDMTDSDIMGNEWSPSIFLLLNDVPVPNFYSNQRKDTIEFYLKQMINIREEYHRAFRSLLFLKYYLEFKKIPWVFSSWSHDFTEQGIKEYFSNLDNKDIKIPEELAQHHISVNFSTYYNVSNDVFPHSSARDGMHWSANFHHNFANNAYANLVNNPIFLETRSKWKTL